MSKSKVTPISSDLQQIQVLSAVINRALLASKLGQQYGGDRDIYQALGYPKDLRYEDYAAFYERLDIAAAVINRPVDATWRGGFKLMESTDADTTVLEKEFQELYERLSLHTKFARLDRLVGIGQYGVLLLGLDDVPTKDAFAKPVTPGKRKLAYIRPFGEGNAQVLEYEQNTSNERYGQPLFYDIKIVDPQVSTRTSTVSQQIRVHWSRIVHVADGCLESEIAGTPRLQAVYNRLMDLEKLVGASAEMFWRGARPGYGLKIDKDFQITTAIQEALKTQFDEYEHNLRRILALQGVEDIKALAQQLGDPKNAVDVIIQMISAETGIPKRILTGSERGELASSQDQDEFNQMVMSRRGEFAEPAIVRQFIDTGIKQQWLPPAKSSEGYSVKFSDLWSMSEKERVEIGKGRATAIKEYSSSPAAEAVVPPKSFRTICLGLTEEENELVEAELEEAMANEELNPEPEPEPIPEGEELQTDSNPCHNPAGPGGGQFCNVDSPHWPGSAKNPKKEFTTEDHHSALEDYVGPEYQVINSYLRGIDMTDGQGNTRELDHEQDAFAKNTIKRLDDMFSKQESGGVLAYRGMSPTVMGEIFTKTGITAEMQSKGIDKLEGRTAFTGTKPPGRFKDWNSYLNARLGGVEFEDKGYISTSRDKDTAQQFLGKYRSRMGLTPNGAPAISLIRGQNVKTIDVAEEISRCAGCHSSSKKIARQEQEVLLPRGSRFRIRSVSVSYGGHLEMNLEVVH